jgi:hypothetical protein
MTTNMRFGNKWTVNEIIALQREYELLEWSVQEIAEKHRRSVRAICCKLEVEGFIASWDEARGFAQSTDPETAIDDSESTNIDSENIAQQNNELTVVDDFEADEQVSNLTERVWNLETNVSEISSMVKQMFDVMVSKKNSKKNKLRNY